MCRPMRRPLIACRFCSTSLQLLGPVGIGCLSANNKDNLAVVYRFDASALLSSSVFGMMKLSDGA